MHNLRWRVHDTQPSQVALNADRLYLFYPLLPEPRDIGIAKDTPAFGVVRSDHRAEQKRLLDGEIDLRVVWRRVMDHALDAAVVVYVPLL